MTYFFLLDTRYSCVYENLQKFTYFDEKIWDVGIMFLTREISAMIVKKKQK